MKILPNKLKFQKFKFFLIFTMILTNTLYATKPSIPLEPQIKRADYVLSAKSINSCTYCKLKNQAKFKIIEILKGKIYKNNISVVSPLLSFDVGTKYILFLRKKDNKFYWINGNSSRLIAMKKNLQNVKELLTKVK